MYTTHVSSVQTFALISSADWTRDRGEVPDVVFDPPVVVVVVVVFDPPVVVVVVVVTLPVDLQNICRKDPQRNRAQIPYCSLHSESRRKTLALHTSLFSATQRGMRTSHLPAFSFV